ncbi:MAG: hypothetical protein ABW042_05275 [Phenylobacterium sp.]
MRHSWLIPLAALALAACQPRTPTPPQGPGAKTAEGPPASAVNAPPAPTVQPAQSASCPPVKQSCPPVATSRHAHRAVRTHRAQAGVRHAAASQGAARVERRYAGRSAVDVPPYGGYRYEDMEDRRVERRYEGGYRYGDTETARRAHENRMAQGAERAPYEPPPTMDRQDQGYAEPSQGRDERYSDGYAERSERRADVAPPPALRPDQPRQSEGYVERRSETLDRSADGGSLRRYEDRTYEESSRTTYSGSPRRRCCVAAYHGPAAGRDPNGFLTWPGKVPAIP